MFPLASTLVGGGLQIVGAIGAYQAQQGYYQSQKNQADLEDQANQQNWNLAKLNFSRAQLQSLRNAQQSRSVAEASAVGSGAQYGSGAKGAQASITSQETNNLLGISQNWQVGQNLFDINQSISTQKKAAANYQQQASFWQGIGSVGGAISGQGNNLKALFPGSQGQPQPQET